MKILVGVLLGLAAAVVLWLSLDRAPTGPVDVAPPESTADGARLAAIESQLARLQADYRQLVEQTRASRVEVAPPPAPFAAAAEPQRPGEAFDRRWYLQQYVHSFEGGGDGSEYFRLAVDAYAVELLDDICALLRKADAAAGLRAALAVMLGKPRFAGSPAAIDALLAVLRETPGDRLGRAALMALEVIGDEGTGVQLEQSFPGLGSLELKKAALAVIVRLCGPDANRALGRLFATAVTSEERALVLAALSTADADGALDVFRRASTAEDAVRLQAANAVKRFRGEAFAQFIGQWLGYEQNAQVRRLLEEARTHSLEPQAYSAQKATGAPDADPMQDHPNAWASRQPDMGRQWLELGYRPARRASAIRIHEVNVAGAVVQVSVVDESGRRHEVWAGVDPTGTPGVFQVSFPTTSFRVKAVRIVLDTDKRPGWSEIDAVELLGPDGNGWGHEAIASSSYGQ
jgi:hypothetical protein